MIVHPKYATKLPVDLEDGVSLLLEKITKSQYITGSPISGIIEYYVDNCNMLLSVTTSPIVRDYHVTWTKIADLHLTGISLELIEQTTLAWEPAASCDVVCQFFYHGEISHLKSILMYLYLSGELMPA